MDGHATRVAVVGGGIGGLSAALSLLQAGFDVQVSVADAATARGTDPGGLRLERGSRVSR